MGLIPSPSTPRNGAGFWSGAGSGVAVAAAAALFLRLKWAVLGERTKARWRVRLEQGDIGLDLASYVLSGTAGVFATRRLHGTGPVDAVLVTGVFLFLAAALYTLTLGNLIFHLRGGREQLTLPLLLATAAGLLGTLGLLLSWASAAGVPLGDGDLWTTLVFFLTATPASVISLAYRADVVRRLEKEGEHTHRVAEIVSKPNLLKVAPTRQAAAPLQAPPEEVGAAGGGPPIAGLAEQLAPLRVEASYVDLKKARRLLVSARAALALALGEDLPFALIWIERLARGAAAGAGGAAGAAGAFVFAFVLAASAAVSVATAAVRFKQVRARAA